MPRPRDDLRRRCMPLTEWPIRDREAWEAAIHSAGLLDESGLAAHWRDNTKRSVIAAYGRYLTFLSLSGWLDRENGPNDRLTRDRLQSYIDELQSQLAPATFAGRLRGLVEAFRVMTPGVTYSYLNIARRRSKARAYPTRNKRERLVPGAEIFQLGWSLMDSAETGSFRSQRRRAQVYRDGLMICMLICRPERRSNFIGIHLGKHILKAGDVYALKFEGSETKGHKTHNTSFDAALTPAIDRYLQQFRPILLRGAETDRMWISWLGKPMAENSFSGMIKARTKKAFGRELTPHLFRDCAVTSLGVERPEFVWIGMSLLHHGDARTTEKHYDHAMADQAVREYQDNICGQRRALKKPSKSRQRLGSINSAL